MSLTKAQKEFSLKIEISQHDAEVHMNADVYVDDDGEIYLNEQVVYNKNGEISMLDNHLELTEENLEKYADHIRTNLLRNLAEICP